MINITNIKAEYVKLSSILSPVPNFISISLEPKEDWNNSIFENSNYARFNFENGKLELISKHYKMPKFRKCSFKTIEECEKKLNNYIQEAINLLKNCD